jgi:hypothetical protein
LHLGHAVFNVGNIPWRHHPASSCLE